MQDVIAGLQPPAPATGRRARGATPIRRGVPDPQHLLRVQVHLYPLVGGTDERIEVNLDPEELREYNLPAEADLCAASICCGRDLPDAPVVTSPYDSHPAGRALDVGFKRPLAGDGVPAGDGYGGRAGDRGGGQCLRRLQRDSEPNLRALSGRHPLLSLRPAPYRAYHQTR